jgi:phage terminase Nu1 subunit (DNA packaging protein)
MMETALKACNASMLAKLYSLTERRVQQLAKDGIFVRSKHGEYDFIASVRGYTDYLKVMVEKEDEPLKRERQRLVKAQADRIEGENKLRDGQLIEVTFLKELLDALNQLYGACVDALPGRLSDELTGIHDSAVVKAKLFEACRELRQVTAERLYQCADMLESAQALHEKPGSCDSADSGPVGG